METQSSIVRSRIQKDVKDNAQEVLSRMGLSMSDALRLFLHQVVAEQRIPFDIKLPKEKTLAALADAETNKTETTNLEAIAQEWINAKKH
jgi:DNA-damage-inducible protein J